MQLETAVWDYWYLDQKVFGTVICNGKLMHNQTLTYKGSLSLMLISANQALTNIRTYP